MSRFVNKPKFDHIFTLEDLVSCNFFNFLDEFVAVLRDNRKYSTCFFRTDKLGNSVPDLEDTNIRIIDKENFLIRNKFKFLLLKDTIIFWNHEIRFDQVTNDEEVQKYLFSGIYKEQPEDRHLGHRYFHDQGLRLFNQMKNQRERAFGGGYLNISKKFGKLHLTFYKESGDFGCPHHDVLIEMIEKIKMLDIGNTEFDFSEYLLHEKLELKQKDIFFVRFFHKKRIKELKNLLSL